VSGLLVKSILLGLLAGLRVVLIPVLLAILANRTHATARGLTLIAGAAGGMVVLCITAWLISDSLATFQFGRDYTNLAILAAGFGLLMALLGVALLVFRPRIPVPERFGKDTGEEDAAPRLGPIAVFALFKTVFNSRILIATLAMAAQLGAAGPGAAGSTAALTAFFLSSMSLLVTIMAYYLLRPVTAQVRLERLSQWTLAHGSQLAGVLALLIGAGLFVNGLSALH
jgi:hypothetical protein